MVTEATKQKIIRIYLENKEEIDSTKRGTKSLSWLAEQCYITRETASRVLVEEGLREKDESKVHHVTKKEEPGLTDEMMWLRRKWV